MQQETETPQDVESQREAPKLLEELKSYAAEHRALWERNYRSFTEEYGSPRDRLDQMRARMMTVFDRLKEQARTGYRKVDTEIARKTGADEVTVDEKKSSNGHRPKTEATSKSA